MNEKNPLEDIIFGLDIGTRNVVGTVGYQADDGFHVIAQCVREHQTRSMTSGAWEIPSVRSRRSWKKRSGQA